MLIVDYGKRAAVYDIESGRVVRELPCSLPQAYLAAWSADGRILATAEVSPRGPTVVHLWDAGTGQRIRSVGGTTFAAFIALSPDGTELLAPLTRDKLATFDVQTGALRKQWVVAEDARYSDVGQDAHGRYFDDGNQAFVPTPLALLLFLLTVAFIIGQLFFLCGRKVGEVFRRTPPAE